ncbi:hypothetical protein Tco_1165697 [Tanacetum coccineum]
MEEASLHTTRKHLFIFTQYYDKHGVPPTKRLFKVAMLDPSPEFIGPWGTSGDPGLPIVNSLQAPIGDLNLSTCLLDEVPVERRYDFLFKHDLCKLVIQKWVPVITKIARGAPNPGEERFKEFAKHSASLVGALLLLPILLK